MESEQLQDLRILTKKANLEIITNNIEEKFQKDLKKIFTNKEKSYKKQLQDRINFGPEKYCACKHLSEKYNYAIKTINSNYRDQLHEHVNNLYQTTLHTIKTKFITDEEILNTLYNDSKTNLLYKLEQNIISFYIKWDKMTLSFETTEIPTVVANAQAAAVVGNSYFCNIL